MKGAYLGMKPPHQSLPNPVPHGILRDPQKILKSLLSQEIRIALVGFKVRQPPKESRPSTPTINFFGPLHLEPKATR